MSLTNSLLLFILIVLLTAVTLFFIKKIQKAKQDYAHLDIDFLINEIKIYIKNTYPNIVIDYQRIEKIKNKHELLAEDILIVEDIVSQFAAQNINIQPKFPIRNDQLWIGYNEYCVPIKGKLPKDFIKRKELAFKKYGGTCGRCGQKLQISNAMTHLFRSIEDGGTFHFENIAIVCSDCNKVLNSKEEFSKIISSLHIYDYLITKINH